MIMCDTLPGSSAIRCPYRLEQHTTAQAQGGYGDQDLVNFATVADGLPAAAGIAAELSVHRAVPEDCAQQHDPPALQHACAPCADSGSFDPACAAGSFGEAAMPAMQPADAQTAGQAPAAAAAWPVANSSLHGSSRCIADSDCEGALQCLLGQCSSPCYSDVQCATGEVCDALPSLVSWHQRPGRCLCSNYSNSSSGGCAEQRTCPWWRVGPEACGCCQSQACGSRFLAAVVPNPSLCFGAMAGRLQLGHT